MVPITRQYELLRGHKQLSSHHSQNPEEQSPGSSLDSRFAGRRAVMTIDKGQ
ncbi:hypothetical protein E4U37_005042 [Claviceps purpurea]|nr:hypothetical protein E4U37_005042 [Claviceps purpurea]